MHTRPTFAARRDSAEAVAHGADTAARDAGKALPAPLRVDAERRFGVDFGAVRIHDGPEAAASARALHAAAYTVGHDIRFGAGRWQPQRAAGQRLLAHELAHVVQQARGGTAAPDAEARADTAAREVLQGRRIAPASLGGAPLAPQAAPEAATAGASLPLVSAPLPLAGALPQTLSSVELEAAEALTKDSLKLVQIAAAARAHPAARVRLAASLTQDSKSSSARQDSERARLNSRMRQARDALQQLGVDPGSIDLEAVTAFSVSARGQVEVAVRKSPSLPASLLAPRPGIGPEAPPAPADAGPSLNLDFEFGPVKVSLPKEVRATLPMALRRSYKLTLDLSYEVPATLGLQIALDGLPHVRLALKGGAEVDPKSGAAVGSAGLVIETTSTLCSATDPGETREKIRVAGEKLNKAALEFQQALPDDKLGKATDIASAIGEIYGAVEAAKAKCKQVPRMSLELGGKKVLAPGDEADPAKRPADYLGGTFTWRF